MGVAQERLGQREDGVGANGGFGVDPPGWQGAHHVDAQAAEQAQHLIFDHVRQRPDHQQLARVGVRQDRHHRGKAGILALGKCRFDARARVVQNPHMGRMFNAQSFSGAGQIQFDNLGRARPDQEQLPDVGAARQKAGDFAVQFFMRIVQTGQIGLFENRRAESGFGENHHPGGALQQMRAGARTDHQEEGILHFPVQPDDAGQTAKHLALAALFQDRRGAAPSGWRRCHVGHAGTCSETGAAGPDCSLATRSFHRN